MSDTRQLSAGARCAAAAACRPATAWPHAFDDRYDLPAPLSYFVAGAAAAVGLSFVVAALAARRTPPISPTLGRFAPIAAGPNARSIVLRAPGYGLIVADAGSAAMVAFVIAMLSTVLFDGLLSGQVWWLVQRALSRAMPPLNDDNGYVIGAIGLVGVWLLFLAAYGLTCWVTAWLVRDRVVGTVARLFALTLVPIAVAYNIAHNFSNLLVQGQQLIPLLSDPLGLKWNLFGAATFYPSIGIVDARFTWYVAIGAIVAGHVISVWLAHRVALREFGAPRKAVIAFVPLTILMVIYTAVSLSVIAEPMVKFETSDTSGETAVGR